MRRANVSQWLVLRSKLILQAGLGHTNQQIAMDLQLTRNTVRCWRERWQALDFIAYFNRLLAKPFKRTFAGRPLQL